MHTDTVTASMGGPERQIGYEFDTRTDHCVIVSKEWAPDCAYRKGFWWYTFTRTPLSNIGRANP